MKNKFLTDIMKAEKINSKLEILDLSSNFEKPDGDFFFPFSICVIPKSWITGSLISIPAGDSSIGLNVSCKLIGDETYSELPIRFGEWSPSTIISIEANAITTNDYRIFVGSGEIME